MIRLAAFDIDGTLASRKTHHVLETTKETILKAQKEGIIIVISTGRSMNSISTEIKELQADYYSCCNGALLYNGKEQVIEKKTISRDVVEQLKKEFQNSDQALLLKYENGSQCICGQEKIDYYSSFFFSQEQLKRLEQREVRIEDEELPIGGIAYIESSNLQNYQMKYPRICFVGNGVENYYDITSCNATKGKALKSLCQRLQIDRESVIAFGDDDNDIDMLEYAGVGVAMGNALPEVKQIANYQTEDCELDGISRAFYRLHILKMPTN
jgi:hypothetical protein